ncbi:protein DMR6-LIKE OXYGENASE 2 isoform X2 [Cryptomeria japonica]|uniref:protein DMR6-LIKE OXYGENASE 2 isoform X2 n=1 Tax=Cryptomeria japonica TaxID=3369 RepID=UPI0027DA8709|nr:protein DMR6-LIKE OXYGENASE 2 isoform X2 [Cryptomeria japonica]
MTSIAPVVEKLLSNHHNHLQGQDKYVFPPGERLDMSQICHSYTFPIIDLKDLDGPHRIKLVNEIRQACEEDGFFQIINHGASETVMKSMMGIAKEFFEMPVEDRVCLNSENLRETVRIFTSFNVTKGQPFEWKDYLRHPCHPLEEFINSWPQKPALYREVAGKYCKELRVLVLRLLAAISEALGQDPDYLNEIFGNHSQVISNGRFKSAEHRAVTNKTTARISIPTFYGPSLDTFIAPAAAMVDEEHPALYRGYKFEEYMAAFWSKCGLKGKSILDRFKIEVSP